MKTASLKLNDSDFFQQAVSPAKEMAAYEALWCEPHASFKSLADKFRQAEDALPSDLVSPDVIGRVRDELKALLAQFQVASLGIVNVCMYVTT